MNNKIKKCIKEQYNISQEKFSAYFYDLNDIKNKIDIIEKYAPNNLELYYAMKANPNSKILEYISSFKYISGFEIASIGEYNKVKSFIKNKNVLYTGPGKTSPELKEAIINNVRLINVESELELNRIIEIAKTLNISVNVLLRINPNYYINECREHMTGISSKLGIDECDLINIYNKYKDNKYVNILGLHVYGASGILDYKVFINYIEYIFKYVENLKNNGFECKIIDFGGGIGIDYTNENKTFDIKSFFESFNMLVTKYKYNDINFIMELGTYLVGECGYYASNIVDIKKCKGKYFIIISGGLNHIGISKDLGKKNPVEILNCNVKSIYTGQMEINNQLCDICGPLCYSGDKISWDDYIERAKVGDLVIVKQAGAYCYSFSLLKFLSHEYPKEHIIN